MQNHQGYALAEKNHKGKPNQYFVFHEGIMAQAGIKLTDVVKALKQQIVTAEVVKHGFIDSRDFHQAFLYDEHIQDLKRQIKQIEGAKHASA